MFTDDGVGFDAVLGVDMVEDLGVDPHNLMEYMVGEMIGIWQLKGTKR